MSHDRIELSPASTQRYQCKADIESVEKYKGCAHQQGRASILRGSSFGDLIYSWHNFSYWKILSHLLRIIAICSRSDSCSLVELFHLASSRSEWMVLLIRLTIYRGS